MTQPANVHGRGDIPDARRPRDGAAKSELLRGAPDGRTLAGDGRGGLAP